MSTPYRIEFDHTDFDPPAKQVRERPEIGFALIGNVGSGLKYPYNPYYAEFSPRIAAAWNPHFGGDNFVTKLFGPDGSVLRGGYGREYGRLNGVDLVLVPLLGTGLIQAVQDFTPASNAAACPACVATGVANAFRVGIDHVPGVGTINAPLPTPSATLPQPDYPGFNAVAAGAGEALDPNFRPTAVDSFDVTWQRQLSRKATLELGYIGRRITHEYQPVNINSVPYMMTLGGQQFAQAYKNVVLQYCGGIAGMAGGGCAKTAGAVTAQPFFEQSLKGTGYCNGFSSCTAAVVANESGNLASQLVWSLWTDLDSGVGCPTGGCTNAANPGAPDAFNFPRSMMTTPIPGQTNGAVGQSTSGIAMNASIGHSNYNAGFVSLKTAEWRGLTGQSNFTWSKALGTGAFVQATSGYTEDDPFNQNEMYGPQFFNRKFVYNAFLVYQPPYYKSQTGLMGRLLGGWTVSPIFTTGSGQPNQIWPSNFTTQSFGEGDSGDNYLSLETAVPIGPLPAHGHAYYNVPSGGLPVNTFKNPGAAVADYRNPLLGLDTRDTSFLTGLPYWNLDFSIRKNVRVAESVALEFQSVFINVLNHNQWLDPSQPWGLFSPTTFGALLGSAQENVGGNRVIQLGARVRF